MIVNGYAPWLKRVEVELTFNKWRCQLDCGWADVIGKSRNGDGKLLVIDCSEPESLTV